MIDLEIHSLYVRLKSKIDMQLDLKSLKISF